MKDACPEGKVLDYQKDKCVSMTSRQRKAYDVINGYMKEIRHTNHLNHIHMPEYHKDDDPLADTRIVLDNGVIQLQYDGAGYDLFSYQADGYDSSEFGGKPGFKRFSESYRAELDKRLKKANKDFYIEDNNNWSLNVAGTVE